MWRHDAAHTAATPRALPARLYLEWTRELPALKPGWPDQPRVQLDAEYEPVVLGTTLFVPSARTDSLTAYDTRSGREKWTYLADGPVRYPAAAAEGRIYFTSDDGYLYCLGAEKGDLLWKFFGAPRDRRILGNERLISTWPARGAPVVADGIVYFGAGIWPFMGTFLYALDAETGRILWSNEGDGSTYMQQPHNSEAFAGVAPQGPMTLIGERLLVPGGRSVPACYDRKTGKIRYFEFAKNSRRGGADVAASGAYFYAGGAAYDLGTGLWAGDVSRAIVATPNTIWYADKKRDLLIAKPPIATTIETFDRKGAKSVKPMWKLSPAETIEAPKIECMIKAGDRIYMGAEGRVLCYEERKEAWRIELPGTPATLLAADDRLFVVTREGKIICFGSDNPEKPEEYPWRPLRPGGGQPGVRADLGGMAGYAILWGRIEEGLLLSLLDRTELRVIAFDPDPSRVQAARREFIAAGLYGERLAIHVGEPGATPIAPYLASVVLLAEPPTVEVLAKTYATLRPFGGRLLLPFGPERRADLEGMIRQAGLLCAEVEESYGQLSIIRSGALPGSGNWTHEHADAANTRVSKDRIAKAPLGILWFGGPSHEGILPRHGHGPQPQVIDGRLIIEGVDKLRATDIYTGRLLWETPLPGLGDFFNNVAHQPGANSRGTNFISTSDSIYVAYKNKCLRLDPVTGKILSEFPVPGKPSVWSYLNVAGDYLIGGADPLMDVTVQRKLEGGFDEPPSPGESILRTLLQFRGDNDTFSSSRRLFVLERTTGRILWEAHARAAFRHNAICAGGGRLYAIDRLSGPQVQRMKKKGETPQTPPLLKAFDLKDGSELWKTEEEAFGTWLSYSAERDILVEAGRVARDTLIDESKGMKARRGSDGSILWNRNYLGPAMIHGDTILMADRACDLSTGAPVGRLHPFTLQPMEWTWARNYGCNTPSASEHLMTFRSGAAGYFDLARDGGTGNFGGFRSSCTNNLIVAGGLINAPDYTRTCICSYQNQTSLALVPMADAEEWTFFGVKEVHGAVKRIGVSLGAPGDRRAEDGTLWVEHPSVGGKSPSAPVGLNPDKPAYFRKSPLRITGESPPWVAASGARGLKELTLTLDRDAKEEKSYTVRLHFVEPDQVLPGGRVFDVLLQGKTVLKDFDIAWEAGGVDRSLVREFREVAAKKELKVAFKPRVGTSVLCGLEVVPSLRVPLFRWALERWAADRYPIVVRTSGAAHPEEETAIAAIGKSGANVQVERVGGATRSELPWIEVADPSGSGPLLYSGRLAGPAIQALLESPARRELLRRLLSGDSAVFVLVECGEKEKDDQAATVLGSTLKELQGSLKLPEVRDEDLSNKTVPLKIEFSVLRVSANDPKEETLIRMLLRGDGRREPLAFPVFGRGHALPGSPVWAEGVRQVVASLVATSANEAKSATRGFDLLMTADWTGLVGEVPGKVTEIPPSGALPNPRPEEEPWASGELADRTSLRYQMAWLFVASAFILVLLLKLRKKME